MVAMVPVFRKVCYGVAGLTGKMLALAEAERKIECRMNIAEQSQPHYMPVENWYLPRRVW